MGSNPIRSTGLELWRTDLGEERAGLADYGVAQEAPLTAQAHRALGGHKSEGLADQSKQTPP